MIIGKHRANRSINSSILQFVICCLSPLDNHDIISMKLYELDSSDPAADEEEGDQDYTQITPKASNAAPHRGKH